MENKEEIIILEEGKIPDVHHRHHEHVHKYEPYEKCKCRVCHEYTNVSDGLCVRCYSEKYRYQNPKTLNHTTEEVQKPTVQQAPQPVAPTCYPPWMYFPVYTVPTPKSNPKCIRCHVSDAVPNKSFCSECYKKYNDEHSKYLQKKICARCNKLFETYKVKSHYCVPCFEEFIIERKLKTYNNICKLCGNLFISPEKRTYCFNCCYKITAPK